MSDKEEVEVEETTNEEPNIVDEIAAMTDELVEQTSETDEPDEEDISDSPSDTPEDDDDAEQERDLSGDDDSEKQDKGGDEAPTIDESLLERAVRAGMTLADAKAISNGDVLERLVGKFESSQDATSKDDVDSKDDAGKEEEDLFANIPELNSDDYPEELVSVFNGLKEGMIKQQAIIKELSSKPQSSESSNNSESVAFVSWFDSKVSELGEDFEPVLGKGSFTTLSDSKTKVARERIVRHMDVVANDFISEGLEVPSQDEVFKLAAKSAFSEKFEEIEGRKIAERSKQRSKKVIRQPRTSTGQFADEEFSDEDADQEAIAVVEAAMRSA